MKESCLTLLHSKRAKIVYSFGLFECNRIKLQNFSEEDSKKAKIVYNSGLSECNRVKLQTFSKEKFSAPDMEDIE